MLLNEYSLRREGETRELRAVTEKVYCYEKNLTTPEEVCDMLQSLYDVKSLAEERVYMIAVSGKAFSGIFEISRGGFDASYLSPREVYSKALIIGATGILIAHNHPSLIEEPSLKDMECAKALRDAGDIIGVKLMDFLILGENYYSFLENKLL